MVGRGLISAAEHPRFSIMRRLTRPLLVLLAIVFLIEAWLWSHLEPLVDWLVARIPLRAAEARIAGMRSNAARRPRSLIVFVIPVAAAVSVQAAGGLAAGAQALDRRQHRVRLLAKLVGLAITAFVFEVTQAQASAAGLVPLALSSACWPGSPGRMGWSHPIKRRIRRLLPHASGRSGPARVAAVVAHPPPHARSRAKPGSAMRLRADAPRAARTAQSP